MADFRYLDSFMENLEKDYHVKGAGVLVLHHGEEIYRNYMGVMDEKGKKAVDKNTLFRMYSMTKPLTVVTALTLFEQGKFNMTDELFRYIPEFGDMQVAELKPSGAYGWCTKKAKNPITIGQLFTMTAGLTYAGINHPAEIEADRALKKLEADTDFSYTTRQFASMLSKTPLMFEPGSHWNYSFCLDVMGALIEIWSGKSFYEYMKEAVLDPLDMKETYFHLPENEKGRLSSLFEYHAETESYTCFGETNIPLYPGKVFESGGAGLISSLDDYGKFASMLSNLGMGAGGKRILSSRTVELMRTDCLNETQKKDMDWVTLAGYGYGLGVRTLVSQAEGGSLSNIGEFGWNGYAGTYFLADPKEELAVVYMQQLIPNMEQEIQPRLRNIVYAALER